MSDDFIYTQFGIDEVYFHEGLDYNLLKKLQQRAVIALDVTDTLVLKHVFNDMVLIYHHRQPNQRLIYGFLKRLHQMPNQRQFIDSHTLLNEEELFDAIKSKTFALVTHRDISTE